MEIALAVACCLMLSSCAAAQDKPLNAGAAGNPYGRWGMGPPSDPSFFPIAVWLQDPKNAPAFKAAGINVYVALWEGPTAAQIDALRAVGMPVICEQNEYALAHKDDRTIIGWMHGDEPDNAQSLGEGKGYGPPITPDVIVDEYRKIQAADPSRPVMLNLGQGVAWDGWYGRGDRTNHPEDYPRYIEGCDLASYDIYPVVHDSPQVAGKLDFVPFGVSRLRQFTQDRKVVWNCIECTRISNVNAKPTPLQVRAEVWMSLIHGSMGLIYFVHQFAPNFVEAALLADPEMLSAVTAINAQIHELAPVLNSPSLPDELWTPASQQGQIDAMLKKQGGAAYVFAVAMHDAPEHGAFEVRGMKGQAKAEVLGENRAVDVTDGRFTDDFSGYQVHLYRIIGQP